MRRFFGGLAMLLALVPLATIAVPATSTAVTPFSQDAVPPVSPTDYDTFDKVTVNPVVNGVEQPVTGLVNVTTPSFDTNGFSVQTLESDPFGPGTVNRNGCSGTPPSYAGKTAWLRFNPGVRGVLTVRVVTGYNAVLMVREATKRALGDTLLTDLDGHQSDCSNVNPSAGGGAEQVATVPSTCVGPSCFILNPAYNYFIQVGGLCPLTGPSTSSPTTCQQSDVPGGNTQIQVSFVPEDRDGDGAPDTTDVCPDVAGQATANGCPDADGDGIRNDNGADNCPADFGVAAVPPYNGCPEGPTPPSTESYVRVLGLDGNLDNSNDVHVKLQLSWPQGAQRMTIDNGDGLFQTFDVAAGLAWELRPLSGSAASEARQVNVTFRGPGIPDTFRTDSITLDTVAPAAPQGEFSAMGVKGWHFFVKATDHGTGVRRIEMLDRQRLVLQTKTFCTTNCDAAERVGLYSRKVKPLFARITDLAGNQRVVKLARSLAACDVPPYKVYRVNSTKSACFRLHDPCVRDPWDWKHADIPLACRKVGGAFEVQKR